MKDTAIWLGLALICATLILVALLNTPAPAQQPLQPCTMGTFWLCANGDGN